MDDDGNIEFYFTLGSFLLIFSIIEVIVLCYNFVWIILLFLSMLSFIYGISIYRIEKKLKNSDDKMTKLGECPYCGSEKTSLKENDWNYYRYKCDNCHKYFVMIDRKNELEIIKTEEE